MCGLALLLEWALDKNLGLGSAIGIKDWGFGIRIGIGIGDCGFGIWD